MAGTYTQKRISDSSTVGSPLFFTERSRPSLAVTHQIIVAPQTKVNQMTYESLVGDSSTSKPGFMTGVSGQMLDEVTSYRSGPKWEGVVPDKGTYYAELLDEAKGTQLDNGHAFNSVKHRFQSNNVRGFYTFNKVYPSSIVDFGGPVGLYGFAITPTGIGNTSPVGGPFNGSNMVFPTVPDVNSVYGNQAISRSIPTNPNVNLLTDILELKDGLPQFPGLALGKAVNKSELLKRSSDEYLNYVFGIVPAVGDIKKFLESVHGGAKNIAQLLRDSDKNVRRRYRFPLKTVNTTYTGTIPAQYVRLLPLSLSNGISTTDWTKSGTSLKVTVQDTLVDSISFSGCFVYHLPEASSVAGRMNRIADLIDRLIGLKLTPDKVWQSIPWSWLVDWFVDVNDILAYSNFTYQYNGLLQYGYLMCDSTYTRLYAVSNYPLVINDGSYGYSELSSTLVTRRKQRIRATPFGFGLNPGSFSDQQWAILGALGLSRGPKTLW